MRSIVRNLRLRSSTDRGDRGSVWIPRVSIEKVLLLALLLACCPIPSVSEAAKGAESTADAARSVQLLDYIAADYPGAVADGKVLDEFEYAEQVEFAGSIESILAGLDAPAAAEQAVAALLAAVHSKEAPSAIAMHAAAARAALVDRFGLVQTPEALPDFAKGKALYEEQCARCHASDGSGETPLAKTFEVAPARFRDPALLAGLSPFRVFSNVTFGLDGTAMPAFDALSEEQRWDIAFYVMALGHGGPQSEAAAPEGLPEELRPTLALLATSSDDALATALADYGVPSAEQGSLVSWLRSSAPARPVPESPMTTVRTRLAAARQALSEGDAEGGYAALLDAYLDGFEALEAPLSAAEPELTLTIERSFSKLRGLVRAGNPDAALQEMDRLRTLVDRADVAFSRRTVSAADPGLFLASLAILLREGLEGVLLVSLLLTLLTKMGREDAKRWVHGAWVLALVSGGLTWWAASALIEISGRSRELIEGIVALMAAAVLFSVAHWFLSKVESEHWLRFLKEKVSAQLSGNRMFAFAGLSFLAVYREVFETTLFYQALLLDVPAQGQGPVLAGIGVGVVLVALISLAIFRAGKRLPIGQLFSVSGVVLYVLCIAFVGEGLEALRAAGALAAFPVNFPTVSMLGIYPDAVGLFAQSALLAVAVGSYFAARRGAEPASS